jgi:hypothetical protein
MASASASTKRCSTSSIASPSASARQGTRSVKLYHSLAELQADLDQWLRQYNEVRTHQGRSCYGKTPMQTFLDSLPMAREKLIDQQSQPVAVTC